MTPLGPALPRLLLAVAAATVLTVLLAVLLLDVPHAVALGSAVLAASALLGLRPGAPEPPEEGEPERAPGGRTDVEETAWSLLDREDRVRPVVLERLRRTAGAAGGRGSLAEVLRTDRTRPVTLVELDRALQESAPSVGEGS